MTAARSDDEGPPARGHNEPAGPAEAGHDVRVGISACLLGEEVRHDGGHKRTQHLIDAFGSSVEWVAVCPEVEAGLGIPREAMRLSRVNADIRLVTVTTARDVTDQIDEVIRRRMQELRLQGLSGYILKANSPSCGLDVKVFDDDGIAREPGRGVFAEALTREFPDLPIEDEGRLSDPRLLAEFVERVFAYPRRRGSA